MRIWEHPDPTGHYVIGADTAEGRMAAAADHSFADPEAERGGRDFSAAQILRISEIDPDSGARVPCLRQVAEIHGGQRAHRLSPSWGPETT